MIPRVPLDCLMMSQVRKESIKHNEAKNRVILYISIYAFVFRLHTPK
jgi:hypothetical protein